MTALGLLGFEEISLEKEYTTEELVVYLMKVFNIADKAISCDFQCLYDNGVGTSSSDDYSGGITGGGDSDGDIGENETEIVEL